MRDDLTRLDALRQRVDDYIADHGPTLPPLEDEPSADGVELVRADTIRPEPVRWLWDGWLARGKLHILAGRPGCGKTTLLMSLAAVVTTGGMWPDGTRCTEPGDVVMWSGEDDPGDTLVPRLMAAGADRTRAHFVGGVRRAGECDAFDPARDVPMLVRELERVRPALLALDPIVSVVAGDSHKNSETRRALQPLVDLASRIGCAVVGVAHLSKATAGREPTERLTGSVAFGAVARVVLLAFKREEPQPGEAARVLVRSKSNIGPDDGGVGYDLEQVEAKPGLWASRVLWAGTVEGSARELIAQAEAVPDEGEEAGALSDAVGFLRALLSDAPMPAKQVRAEADGAGHSWATIRRAAKRLGVEARKTGMQGGWVWALPPEDAHQTMKVSTPKNMSTFGNFEHLREADGASIASPVAPAVTGPAREDAQENPKVSKLSEWNTFEKVEHLRVGEDGEDVV